MFSSTLHMQAIILDASHKATGVVSNSANHMLSMADVHMFVCFCDDET